MDKEDAPVKDDKKLSPLEEVTLFAEKLAAAKKKLEEEEARFYEETRRLAEQGIFPDENGVDYEIRNNKLYTTIYLHSNHDEYEDWELDPKTHAPRFPEKVHDILNYMLYEVAFDVEIDLKTGNYRIIAAHDGDTVLKPSV